MIIKMMNEKFTKSLLLLIVFFTPILSACASGGRISSNGFDEPDPETYVRLVPIVWEYFHHRKAAALSGNLDAFYVHYRNYHLVQTLKRGSIPKPSTRPHYKASTFWTGTSSQNITLHCESGHSLTRSKS